MIPADQQQRRQESRYRFPYHYVPDYDGGNFTQARVLSWGYEYLAYLRFILSRVQSLRFDSLLDAGCGDGRFLFELRKMFPDKELVGIDTSETAIGYARALSPNAKYICGDIRDRPELHGRFDIVTSIEVLEHIPPDGVHEFIHALHGCLKSDGLLVLTVPTKNVEVPRKHYQHFDLEFLNETLAAHFAVSEHYFINRISRWAKWMECLLVNRWFILRHQGLLNLIYRSYEKRLVIAQKHNAKRICAVCRKREAM